jgi:uncharacterized protein YacL
MHCGNVGCRKSVIDIFVYFVIKNYLILIIWIKAHLPKELSIFESPKFMNMYIGFKHLHSTLAYLLLAMLLISIVWVAIGLMKRKPFTEKTRKIALFGLIATHIQFVIGLVLYFLSPAGYASLSSEAMKDAILRHNVIEHPITMIMAVVFITIGYSRSKRLEKDSRKYNSILIFYLIGLMLILLRIPWHIWPGF